MKQAKDRAKPLPLMARLSRQDTVTLLVGFLGLFLGRVAIFGSLNPVAIGFLASYILRGYRIYLAAVFIALGIATQFGGPYVVKYLFAIGIVVAAHVYIDRRQIRATRPIKSLVAFGAVLVPGLVLTTFMVRGGYYVGMTFLEASMAAGLVHLMDAGIRVLEGKDRELDNESLLSTAIVLGMIVAGVADIYVVGVSLKHFASAVVVLIIAQKGNSTTATTAGVIMGLIIAMTTGTSQAFIAVLAVAGMLAGLGKNSVQSITGFGVGWALMALFVDPDKLSLGWLASYALASVVVYFGPSTPLSIAKEAVANPMHLEKTKEYTATRLAQITRSFNKLAETLGNVEKKYTLSEKEVSDIIDDVANSTCVNCNRRDKCWGAALFTNTYETFQTMVATYERQGPADRPTEALANFCSQPKVIVSNMNHTQGYYKNNLQWQNRTKETKEIVAWQLKQIGGVLNNVAADVENHVRFSDYLEEALASAFELAKLEVENVIVLENQHGRYTVELKYRGARKLLSGAGELISRIVGRPMVESEQRHNHRLCFVEEQKYRVSTGLAKISKEDSRSGDSHGVMHVSGAKALVMLSDGMGSGGRASEESAATVDMFEDFMSAGFDKETSVKIINSIKVLSSEEDYFSTLDACLVDLYSGMTDFVKMGASATYVLGADGVDVVTSKSLPMGILNDVQVEPIKKRLQAGDIVVMVTDGVAEPTENPNGEDELLDMLQVIDLKDPQDIADRILSAVKSRTPHVKDDMTVLVAKLLAR